jgi:hypothetical protein
MNKIFVTTAIALLFTTSFAIAETPVEGVPYDAESAEVDLYFACATPEETHAFMRAVLAKAGSNVDVNTAMTDVLASTSYLKATCVVADEESFQVFDEDLSQVQRFNLGYKGDIYTIRQVAHGYGEIAGSSLTLYTYVQSDIKQTAKK